MGDPHLNPAEYDFIAARRRTEAKAKSAAEKLTSLTDAASRVKDGDRLGVGGCLFSRTPLALMREILRQRRRGLTLARNLTCNEGELFMVAGAASRVMTAWMSIGLPWGVSKILRHYVETGAVALEEWSHLALGLRFRAGAMGVPFLPALTMLGSDLVGVGGLKTVEDPYTGETLAAVPALFPDVALVHVHRADRFGNCQIDGYPHMDADIARAATTVLAEASLSFLGLGAQPPTASWGAMVSTGKEFLRQAPWVALFPGLFLAATVLALNLLGDSLRDALDPRER